MALLWLDIVDSTRIAENILARGDKLGIDQFGKLLDQYFDTLLTLVVEHGGQPLMFAGDALLSGWPCANGARTEAALRAAQCGLTLLSRRGSTMPSGEPLQFHAVLAFGACRTCEIGTDEDRIYVTVGQALNDLRRATRVRAAGQLLVSPEAFTILEPEIVKPETQIEPSGHGCVLLKYIQSPLRPIPLQPPRLAESKVNERLRAHVPRQIKSQLHWVTGQSQLQCFTERRRINVVFAYLSELDRTGEDITIRLQEVVQELTPIVRRYGGDLHQLRVDEKGANLRILFGTPETAHLDDAERAVGTSLELEKKLRNIGVDCKCGITTSTAVCCVVGNDIFRSDMVYANGINLASRLARIDNTPEQIFCDDDTVKHVRRRRGTGEDLIFARFEHPQIKGKELTIPTWTVRHQEHGQQTKPDMLAIQGRAGELKQLRDALDEAAVGRHASVVLVEGETGIGKSRLLSEFRENLLENTRVLAGAADRIEQRVPYHGWRSIYAQLLEVDRLDDDDRRPANQEKVLQALEALEDSKEDRGRRSALLNAVLPLDFVQSSYVERLSDNQRVEERLRLLISLLHEAARHKRLVVIIDDAQWLDDASWELLLRVTEEVPNLCLVVSMQPLSDKALIDRLRTGGARWIELQELGRREQILLISDSLGADRIADNAKQLIESVIERAQGNPLFCIELARSLQDEGILEIVGRECRKAGHIDEANLPLPDTVEKTVQRRIDALMPQQKFALKVASATGMRFPTALVEKVCTHLKDEELYPFKEGIKQVGEYLRELSNKAALLVPDKDIEGYAFRHGLIRQGAYELLDSTYLVDVHLPIAGSYGYQKTKIPKASDTQSRNYALLAHHLEEAGNNAKHVPKHAANANEYLKCAADYLKFESQRIFGLGLARQSTVIGRDAARLYEVNFPDDIGGIGAHLGRELEWIASWLATNRVDELKEYDELEIDRLLRLLVRIAPFAFQSNQVEFFCLMIAVAQRLTLQNGSGPVTPEVFSMFSIIARNFPNVGDGIDWSRRALDLLPVRDDRYSRVAFVHNWFHNHWISTLENSIRRAEDAKNAATAHEKKEIIFESQNSAARIIYMAAAGKPLPKIIAASQDHLNELRGRVMNADFHARLELQMAKALAGKTKSRFDLSDPEDATNRIDEDKDLKSICETELANQIGFYHIAHAKLRIHFGAWHEASERLRPALDPRILPYYSGQVEEIEMQEIRGIAVLAEAAFGGLGTTEAQKAELTEEGCACINNFRNWNERWKQWNPSKPSMFQHKLDLLEGIAQCAKEPSEDAAKSFEQSADAAKSSKYLHDAALAYEFLARCHQRAGRDKEAEDAINKAIDASRIWGADEKIKYLNELKC